MRSLLRSYTLASTSLVQQRPLPSSRGSRVPVNKSPSPFTSCHLSWQPLLACRIGKRCSFSPSIRLCSLSLNPSPSPILQQIRSEPSKQREKIGREKRVREALQQERASKGLCRASDQIQWLFHQNLSSHAHSRAHRHTERHRRRHMHSHSITRTQSLPLDFLFSPPSVPACLCASCEPQHSLPPSSALLPMLRC